MSKVTIDAFRVPHFKDKTASEGKNGSFKLASYDCAAKPFSAGGKDADRQQLSDLSLELDVLQDRMHAQTRERVLLVLQGMDTSGKDGTIRAVFREVDPLGLRIAAFRAPTPDEIAHDFLWRVHRHTPAGGELAIFNRSHYEDVLVPRVTGAIDKGECERRYAHIRHFESLLADTHTTIIKCFLHISKDTQRERLQARVDDPTKHWKFDPSDLEARQYWDDYQAAYEDALAATSTPEAPWYIVPADSKTHRNVMVATILAETMRTLKLEYPPAKHDLEGIKVK
ncbi:polyphosphate kinase 2 family protein [Pararobbsia silviterrae]|uniref:Polyphosphate kinase 2 family protein n=1 Tax=Pararobbsia silviterrae TaxID=1792498 RepID=A0A494Y788_9BURK|nr:polyphosphate kinase 2 family protein [Pararobbsia silviterrae]RKP58581.1 polyphosphate kinase 2 family protein [Pararobbsia silviterrae]